MTSLALSFILGPWLIEKLRNYPANGSNGVPVRDYVPSKNHVQKSKTPTMGGLLILICMIGSTLLWANLTNSFIWLAIIVTLGMGTLGFIDDHRKLKYKSSEKGLSKGQKIFWQLFIGLLAGAYLVFWPDAFNTELAVPFLKKIHPNLGWGYVILAALVIISTANAVNITDGLDGLAIGPTIIATLTFLLLTYLSGHAVFAQYLLIPHIPGAGELTVFCGGMLGAGLGFLWYNTYPAQVFMGDIGSLSLGGALGTLALSTKNELLLIIIGGVFVLEAMSVIIQVASFQLRGKRVFLMAPIHHHFELKGWSEPKIIVRFWIIAVILALFSLSTMKLR